MAAWSPTADTITVSFYPDFNEQISGSIIRYASPSDASSAFSTFVSNWNSSNSSVVYTANIAIRKGDFYYAGAEFIAVTTTPATFLRTKYGPIYVPFSTLAEAQSAANSLAAYI